VSDGHDETRDGTECFYPAGHSRADQRLGWGLWPGLLATLLATLASLWFLLPPYYTFTGKMADDLLPVGVFLLVALLINALSEIRRRTSVAFSESEERFRRLFESAPCAVAVFDLDNRLVMTNPQSVALYGYGSEAEMIGLRAENFIAPEDRDRIDELRQLRIENGGYQNLERRMLKKDGTVFTVEINGSVIRDPSGNPMGWLAIAHDITWRKRAEEERERLLASEQRAHAEAERSRRLLAGSLERITDAFVALDFDCHFTYVNERAGRLLNRRPEDLIGKEIWTEFPEGIGQPFYQACRKALAEQQAVEIENYYQPWGRWFENRIYPAADGLTIYFHDVTERKRTEEMLRESQMRLELAVLAAQVGLWDWNLSTNEVYFSPEYKRLLGYGDDELLNRFEEWTDRLHPEDRERTLSTVRAYIRQPWPNYSIEFRLRHRDGSWRWIFTRAQVFLDAEGKPARMLGSHLDITERKQTEEQLRKNAEQLRALSAWLRSAREEEGRRIAREIHDEIGGALTGLRWDLEKTGQIASEAVDEKTRARIRVQVTAMKSLIDDTIQTVRRISAELRPGILDDLGLVAAIEWQAQQFQERTGIACEFDGLPETASLDQAQATAVFRIFQEILTNVMRHARATRVSISLREEAGSFWLTVSDNGRGITESEKSDVHSLGLLGMHERAHLAGGEVSISGTPGRGTIVTVRIPLSEAALSGTEAGN
jgi:two-component system sensor histidine kinase UhpB